MSICPCGAGLPGKGIDPGVCHCDEGSHCVCIHMDRCDVCDRAGWHTDDCHKGDEDKR